MSEPTTDLLSFKKKTVFISGPMSGYEAYNTAAFYNIESKLRNLGFSSIKNPASIGKKYGYDQKYEFYLRKSFKLLLDADAIYVFGDYAKSKGALAEIELAHSIRLPVFFEEYNEL